MECFMNADFDYGAITVGHTVLWGGSEKDWEDEMEAYRIDDHEGGHVNQVEKFGGVPFYVMYGIAAPIGVIADFLTFRIPDIHDSNPFEKIAESNASQEG